MGKSQITSPHNPTLIPICVEQQQNSTGVSQSIVQITWVVDKPYTDLIASNGRPLVDLVDDCLADFIKVLLKSP